MAASSGSFKQNTRNACVPGLSRVRAWAWAIGLYLATTGVVFVTNTLVE